MKWWYRIQIFKQMGFSSLLFSLKGWWPTGVQGSPSELNFFTTFEGIVNPEPFDRRKF